MSPSSSQRSGVTLRAPLSPIRQALRGQAVEQNLVGRMRALDRQAAVRFLELGRASGVVDVAVREQNFLDREADLLDGGVDAIEIAAGIDHRTPHSFLVPQQRAVLLERRDRNDGCF